VAKPTPKNMEKVISYDVSVVFKDVRGLDKKDVINLVREALIRGLNDNQVESSVIKAKKIKVL